MTRLSFGHLTLTFLATLVAGVFLAKAQAAPPKFCTREYAPVCALVPVQCVRAPCTARTIRTFPNTCEAKKAGAQILFKGKCGRVVYDPAKRPVRTKRCRKWVVTTVCRRYFRTYTLTCKKVRRCVGF